MVKRLEAAVTWLLGPEAASDVRPGHLWPRWIFLRTLGVIYFSAFYSLLFQIRGLIGPNGILPAQDYLQAVAAALPYSRFWYAPSLFCFGASNRALMFVCWAGIVASLLVVLNIWPRASLLISFACFLSFVAVARDFAYYQSDGMLLEAGFLALFFAPPGLRPALGRAHAPSRANLFLLRWEWFRIYFESGVVKLQSHDRSWRDFTAMDDYYQNGPLPTWIGWHVQHFPHWFHAATVFATFAVELVLVWMLFLPRRFRVICFCILTPFQIGIILTANYAFLNYLVLFLGFLLLDDRFVEWIVPQRIRSLIEPQAAKAPAGEAVPESKRAPWRKLLAPLCMGVAGGCFAWIFYVTAAQVALDLRPTLSLPDKPMKLVEPFRIANGYGLFAVMTHARYEIEFQGLKDDGTWATYPFRYKPQDVRAAPGIYAPYQPRFEWNLWFASLGPWPQYRFVIWTEERLLSNEPDVLALFAANPFAGAPPRRVRTVFYQYWFTDAKTKREQGTWWRRELLGEYAPGLERAPDGRIVLLPPASLRSSPQ
jgi:lipase maturation factor